MLISAAGGEENSEESEQKDNVRRRGRGDGGRQKRTVWRSRETFDNAIQLSSGGREGFFNGFVRYRLFLDFAAILCLSYPI